jgi:hypothetical protein
MQRSSPSIAALATALAKAQIELTNPEKSLIGTIEPQGGRAVAASSAMRRCQAGLRSYARPWASMRSPRYRPPRSIRRPGSSISPLFLRTPQANGSHPIGRSARLAKPKRHTAWARR